MFPAMILPSVSHLQRQLTKIASKSIFATQYNLHVWAPQVMKWRPLNHLIGGDFIGHLLTGLSHRWWTEKHSIHHAAPNEVDSTYHAVDPDIDTLPFLAWSPQQLSTVESPAVKAVLRWQRELFFPILLLARLAW